MKYAFLNKVQLKVSIFLRCYNCQFKRRIKKLESENKELKEKTKICYADIYKNI
ncbi:hypothetical protein [Clostridium beijerinckii]|uniref:hypothetical protein n=1 Tax=Clostridium beijerinckii TaxID=1520 RepID=UPI0003D37BA4|nr:hypothetical protein [Clostridium beijerinckii]